MAERILLMGEPLIRLTNQEGNRFKNAQPIIAYYGGAECNVACSLAGWKNDVSLLSAVPNSVIGRSMVEYWSSFFVKTNEVVFDEDEFSRMGMYFFEKSQLSSLNHVVYDRRNSAFCNLTLDDQRIDYLVHAYDVFYVSGIALALNAQLRSAIIKLFSRAHDAGKKTFFDCNYRPKLWNASEAAIAFADIMPYVNICFAGMKDLQFIFNLIAKDELDFGSEKYEASLKRGWALLMKKYPNIFAISGTARKVLSSDEHLLQGYLMTRSEFVKTNQRLVSRIVDRIGSGDGFAAGFVHGFLAKWPWIDVLNFAFSSGVMQHYFSGDCENISLSEIMSNVGATSDEDINR